MNILVTGGAGYIGSHAVLRLLSDHHPVTVIDDLSRGHAAALDILKSLGDLQFHQGDFGNFDFTTKILRDRKIDLVMHFGAKAYVGESVEQPLNYYRNNTAGALALLEAVEAAGVPRFVFSSTCATYGEPPPENIPINEECPQNPINPYGRSKLMVEHILRDYAQMKRDRNEDFSFAALRYFNVAGSDSEGRIGEDHKPETHLIPICLEVALGQRPHITIYGTDYPTPDGTCIRDYVHVEDLIDAHVTAMNALSPGKQICYNIGIGQGYSVREVIDASRRVTGVNYSEKEGPRRPGDPPELYNNPQKVNQEFGWKAKHTNLDEIISTAWRWKQNFPNGYPE